MTIDRTYASASLIGRAPAATVTLALGLEPTSTHEVGRRRSSHSDASWDHSAWRRDTAAPRESGDLETHLQELVELLGPKRVELENLVSAGWELTWACFVSETGGQGGFRLSSGLLRELGRLPGELWIDIYAGVDEEVG